MDPFTHTFTGGLLASSGLKKTVPLATAALLIGANLPDIDIFVSLMGEQASIAHRRGWTHGVLAWVVLPSLLTFGLLGFAKWRGINDQINPWILFSVSLLAILSHPLLDWLNNYGVRFLMPFDESWFYGDTLFVVDPWMWLMLGGAYYLIASQHRVLHGAWLAFWVLTSLVVIFNPFASLLTNLVWGVGLATIFIVRLSLGANAHENLARGALLCALIYTLGNGLASHRANAIVLSMAQVQESAEVIDVMVAPMPADPSRGSVVIEYEDSYRVGIWDWFGEEKLTLLPQTVLKNLDLSQVKAAKQAIAAERFLSWSRFPFAVVDDLDDGFKVTFEDARYAFAESGIRGPGIFVKATANTQ